MSNHVTIIAEAGVNHNGSLEQAKELINAAVHAGADYVKFQTFDADKLVSKRAKKARYQSENITGSENVYQHEMLKKLQLSREQHIELIEYCQRMNIRFLSTPFDEKSIELLVELGVDYLKIPSGELTNKPFLECIGQQRIPVILSTGMSTLAEVQEALEVLLSQKLVLDDITVLHCNTEYPTPFEDVNLRAMKTMEKAFRVKIGYSDHTLGIEIPIAAVVMGARVIEKHFTLDRDLPGPDHRASLEPDELKKMVESVRNIEKALGTGFKKPSDSEKSNITVVRKSIHAATDIAKGALINPEDLVMLRPGDGLSPMDIDEVIGKKVVRTISGGEKLKRSDLK